MSVYDEELDAINNRPTGGGGGDFVWLDIPTPASKGQSHTKRIRVLQRLPWNDGAPDPANPHRKFWVRTEQHRVTIDGTVKMLTCPEDKDNKNWKDTATCPICLLQMELYKGPKEHKDLAYDIRSKPRCFCNVIDLDEPASHWAEDGNNGYIIRAHVWGYSLTMHKALLEMCKTFGAIEDFKVGRNLFIKKERVGPKKRDVRYSVMQDDRSEVPAELMPVVYHAWDLSALAKAADLEALRQAAVAIDPRVGAARTAYGSAAPAPAGYAPPPPAAPPTAAPPPAAAPPPVAAPAVPMPGPYWYRGPTGEQAQVDALAIARLVVGGGQAHEHQVWAEGWPNWAQADQAPDIAAAVQQMQPAPAAPPPAGPPGYVPQGGYPVGGPPAPAAPPAPPAPPGPPGPPAAAAPPGPPAAAAPPAPPGPPAGNPPGPPGPPAPPGGPPY